MEEIEDERVLRVAFEMVCIGLRTGDCDDGVKQAIATKLIALVKTGERNPDILCEEILKDIRTLHSTVTQKRLSCASPDGSFYRQESEFLPECQTRTARFQH